VIRPPTSLVGLVVGVVLLGGCGVPPPPPRTTAPAAPSAPMTSPSPVRPEHPAVARIAGRFRLTQGGFGPLAIAVGFGSVWVALAADPPYSPASRGTLLRLSRDLSRVEARIQVGWVPAVLAVTSNAIWVADTAGDGSQPRALHDEVERVDPALDQVVARVYIDGLADLVPADGAAWAVGERPRGGGASLSRIDEGTNSVRVVVASPGAVSDLARVGPELWAATAGDAAAVRGSILRLDASTGAAGVPIALDHEVTRLLVAGDRVLAMGPSGTTASADVLPIDPANGVVGRLLSGVESLVGSAFHVGIERIWVGSQQGLVPVRLPDLIPDAAPLTIIDQPGAGILAIAGDSTGLWVLTSLGVVRVTVSGGP